MGAVGDFRSLKQLQAKAKKTIDAKQYVHGGKKQMHTLNSRALAWEQELVQTRETMRHSQLKAGLPARLAKRLRLERDTGDELKERTAFVLRENSLL